MDALFHEFLREAGLSVREDPAYAEARKLHAELVDQAQAMRNEIANLEEQREGLASVSTGRFSHSFSVLRATPTSKLL